MITLTICGAGTMGAGIAHVGLSSGFQVHLFDPFADALDRGAKRVHATLDKSVARGKMEPADREACSARFQHSTSLEEMVSSADLVIEAIPESIALKTALFGEMAPLLGDHTIVATNTSALPVAVLAEATGRPDRFLGMHFFNPPYVLKLLEIVRATKTSDATLNRVLEIADVMDRVTIVVRDAPGFASSRLGLTLANEAMRMLEQEVASAHHIDTAMRTGYGHPMGPLELTDLVGLDVRLAITKHLFAEIGTDVFRPPAILEELVHEGNLGKKSGRGFYRWVDGKKLVD
jgi:3-hydroxybutyryl-CoA dehydrogenase